MTPREDTVEILRLCALRLVGPLGSTNELRIILLLYGHATHSVPGHPGSIMLLLLWDNLEVARARDAPMHAGHSGDLRRTWGGPSIATIRI
jgi:hypothetical protein